MAFLFSRHTIQGSSLSGAGSSGVEVTCTTTTKTHMRLYHLSTTQMVGTGEAGGRYRMTTNIRAGYCKSSIRLVC